MAEQGRTVRVSGLPTDVQDERLEDKLCIHFQRGRNGGGEVLSVATFKTAPDFALITFEDSRVAQRVIQHHQHILEVDGKSFNLSVKQHPADTPQDRVIISLSATVDCSQLSAGKKTLKALNKNHPDVQMNYNSARGLCNLSGSYSAVQAALAQLLGQNEHPRTSLNKDPKTRPDNKPNHSSPTPQTQVSPEQSKGQKDKKEKPLVEKHASTSQRDSTPGGYEWEAQGATASPPGFEEDFSLMVDADMFQYLQKYCGEEYHQILRRHGVAVVDFTHQGLTTLLLQVASGEGEREQAGLWKAKEEISRLYEANRANVCRDTLSKVILPDRVGLKRVIDKLTSQFAKLLLSEDENNIYLIGSKLDVGEARKFLLFHDPNKEDKVDVTSPSRFQDSWPSNEVKAPIASSSVSEGNAPEQVEDESKLEGSPKIKLAAQFNKDSRLAPIGSKMNDFAVRAHTQSKTRPRQGPMLGYDVLSDAKVNSYANAQSTRGDILFKSKDPIMDTRPKTAIANPIQSESLHTSSSLNLSGPSLRRSSSFSGVTQKKEQESSPKSDSETGKGRGRSSSFSNGSKREQHTAEITVNLIMWSHITKAYKPRIMELTSEIQMTEKRSDRGQDVIVLLTGTNLSKITACQEDLQKLIDSVGLDFTIKSLPLSNLGVSDATNEELQACFVEIRSLYKKISMEIYDKVLYLFGPEVLCSKVSQLLTEIFSGAQLFAVQQDYSQPSVSGSSVKINGTNAQDFSRKDAVIREKVAMPSNVQESIKNSKINGSVTSRVDKNITKRQQPLASGGPECGLCGRAGATVKKTLCGVTICSDCLVKEHSQCRVCEVKEEPRVRGIQGKMSFVTLPLSIPGYIKDPVIKITYSIPDGIQGENDPSPGNPFKGDVFEAFLPDCEQTRHLLPRLTEAFKRGHTFTVNILGKVSWSMIPHKTSLQGGKSVKGYPDSSYLSQLSEVLQSFGI